MDDKFDFQIHSIQFHVHWPYLCSMIASIIVTDRDNPVRCTMGIYGRLLCKNVWKHCAEERIVSCVTTGR